uniref:Ig-like domain-containing protein n=1 Tax=Mesocestoides corti TaxID=53468 RepID=A0A5K3FYP3_MESCO
MLVALSFLTLYLTSAHASSVLTSWPGAQSNGFCQNPDIVSVLGSSPSRMVSEGGRIVIVCCVIGNTSGHDHEQLMWTDPSGKPIINYFSNSVQAAQSRKYAVPDFSDKNRI